MSMNKDEDWATGPEWENFVTHHRTYTAQAMAESAYVMSLVPKPGKVDVKFAVELGMAIMLDKPIIAMAQPGTPIPPGLRKVADAIIVADLDTEAGKQEAALQLAAIMKALLQPLAFRVKHDRGVHHAVFLRRARVLVVIPGCAAAQDRREPDQHLPLVHAGLPGRLDVPFHVG